MKTTKQLRKLMFNNKDFTKFATHIVYSGHTTKDMLIREFKIPIKHIEKLDKSNWSMDLIDKLGYDSALFSKFVRDKGKEVDRCIESRFEKYRIELNNFFNK